MHDISIWILMLVFTVNGQHVGSTATTNSLQGCRDLFRNSIAFEGYSFAEIKKAECIGLDGSRVDLLSHGENLSLPPIPEPTDFPMRAFVSAEPK